MRLPVAAIVAASLVVAATASAMVRVAPATAGRQKSAATAETKAQPASITESKLSWHGFARTICTFGQDTTAGGVWRSAPSPCLDGKIEAGRSLAGATTHISFEGPIDEQPFSGIADDGMVTITVSYVLRRGAGTADWAQLLVLANGYAASASLPGPGRERQRFGEGVLTLRVPADAIRARSTLPKCPADDRRGALDVVLLLQTAGAPETRVDWVDIAVAAPSAAKAVPCATAAVP